MDEKNLKQIRQLLLKIKSDLQEQDKLAKIFVSQCLKEHVISYACGVNFNSIKIIPSLVVTNEEIDIISEKLDNCLQRFHNHVK